MRSVTKRCQNSQGKRRTDGGKVDADARAYVETGKKGDGDAGADGIFRHVVFFFYTEPFIKVGMAFVYVYCSAVVL